MLPLISAYGATRQLREFIVKGFVLDDERLKNPDQPFDYFEELLRRIQDIRTSERRFYQKLPTITPPVLIMIPLPRKASPFSRQFKTNCTGLYGMTAAELIHSRADSGKPYMGLTSWRGAKVRKQDVGIAKNYLSEKELLALNNLVEQYLLFAERQARLRRPMHRPTGLPTSWTPFLGSTKATFSRMPEVFLMSCLLPMRNRNMISFTGSSNLRSEKKKVTLIKP